MEDVDPRVSKLILFAGALSAILNLADSIRTRGPLRATTLFALSTGLPALGEALVTGPLYLLRHRAKPRIRGASLSPYSCSGTTLSAAPTQRRSASWLVHR